MLGEGNRGWRAKDAFGQIVGKHERLVARIGISKEEAARQSESFEEANQDCRPPDGF